MEKRKKYNIIFISILLIIYSILLIVIKNNTYKKESIINKNHSDSYNLINHNNIATLIIPKIKLNKDLVNENSSSNNVKYNIEIIKGSTMPDKDKSNLILAAHSGNYKNSYFKDLYLLNLRDTIIIKYKEIKYEYVVSNKYLVDKKGYVDIIRNKNKKTITLITCDQTNKTKQIVIIGELKNQVLL